MIVWGQLHQIPGSLSEKPSAGERYSVLNMGKDDVTPTTLL